MARPRKKPLEPISLEELTNAPAMSGFVSFLNVKPWEQLGPSDESSSVDPNRVEASPVVPATLEHQATVVDSRTPPVVTTLVETDRAASAPVNKLSANAPLVLSGAETPAVSTGVDYFAVRHVRIQEVRVLQDSLSFGEESLYNALWANANPCNAEARQITIGFERMSRIARLTDKNCKLNCRALMEKRVVEEIADTNFRDGRTYLIYSFQAALGRQRQAGLTHVVRTRGVVFVDPQSGRELTHKQHRRRVATPVVSTGAQ